MDAVLKRFLQHHDQLIELIYHAAVEPAEWESVLARLVELLEGHSALLLFMDGSATSVQTSYTVNMDEGYFRQYAEYYMNVCPWRAELQHKPNGQIYSSYIDFTNDQNTYHRSEFYTDWARPLGIEHCVCGNVVATPEYAAQLLVQRTAERGHFTREETAAINRLLPCMQKALALQLRLSGERQMRESVIVARQQSHLPCIVLNTQLAIAHIDERVIPLLANWPELHIINGRIVLRDERLNGLLQRQLKGCAAAAKGEWSLAGGCVRLQDIGVPLELHLYPLHATYSGLPCDGNPYVALYINNPGSYYRLNEQLVRESFGLSPAEMRLAEGLCNGQSLDEFAAKNGTTLNTVRSQAKQIFAKTGVRRQVELPKRLLPYLKLT